MIALIHFLLGENGLFKAVGDVFHPIFKLFAEILAGIYKVIPNYAVAIAILTIVIMAALTPLTVKSTKSMVAMQALAPELQKLRQKYKGRDNAQQLNEEMMKLYRENGVNPAGGCLPMFLQFPFLIVLYDLIRGLAHTTSGKHPIADPLYLSHNTLMYHNLIAAKGQMISFGMDFSTKAIAHHNGALAYIPYFAMILVAVGLQYIQMNQINRRNPQAAQANKQMQQIQKFMPIVMAYIYFLVPAGVIVYMIVSSLIRVGTQEVLLKAGVTGPAATAQAQRSISGTKGASSKTNGTTPTKAIPAKSSPVKKAAPTRNGSNGAAKNGTAKSTNGSNGSGGEETSAPKAHPRAKDKRTRKAR